MNTRALMALAASLVLASVFPASSAWADPPVTSEGTFYQVSAVPTDIRVNGNMTQYSFTYRNVTESELLNSTDPSEGSLTCLFVHGKDTFHCHGEGMFYGTLAGVPGEGQARTRSSMTCSVSTGVCEGRELFQGVSGTLADVHGTTVFRSTNVNGFISGTFTDRVHRH